MLVFGILCSSFVKKHANSDGFIIVLEDSRSPIPISCLLYTRGRDHSKQLYIGTGDWERFVIYMPSASSPNLMTEIKIYLNQGSH